MPIARYSKPILIIVQENLEGISKTKGRDQGVIKYSSAITATISYTSVRSVYIRSVYASFVCASSI